MNMKKMTASEMRHVNGGFWGAAALGWFIGRTLVCGRKGLFKC